MRESQFIHFKRIGEVSSKLTRIALVLSQKVHQTMTFNAFPVHGMVGSSKFLGFSIVTSCGSYLVPGPIFGISLVKVVVIL